MDKGIKKNAKKHGLDINFAGSAPRHNLSFSDSYDDPNTMKAVFYQEMVKQGILFSNLLYIQFSHTEKDMNRVVKASNKAFKVVKDNLDNLDAVLEGQKPVDIFRKNT